VSFEPVPDVLVMRPQNLGDLVLEQIEELIISKRLPPNAMLSEATIASMLGVSKTPVREALIQLRVIGLVVSVDRRLRVVVPSEQLILDAYETRACLEAYAINLTTERASGEQREAILEEARASLRCVEAGDQAGFRKHDRQFHILCAESCGNTLLFDKVRQAMRLCSAVRQRDAMSESDSLLCAQAHVAMASAIIARDGATASAHMTDHIDHVKSTVLAAVVPELALSD
jgi:DNA-binding GntR family transcriptional regulator